MRSSKVYFPIRIAILQVILIRFTIVIELIYERKNRSVSLLTHRILQICDKINFDIARILPSTICAHDKGRHHKTVAALEFVYSQDTIL